VIVESKIIALIKRDVFVIFVSIIVTFILFIPWMILVNKWAGDYYFLYQILNNILLFSFFLLFSIKISGITNRIYILIFLGVIIGYISSLFSIIITTILMPNGFVRLMQSVENFDSVLSQLNIPLAILSWLYGGIAGGLIGLLKIAKDKIFGSRVKTIL